MSLLNSDMGIGKEKSNKTRKLFLKFLPPFAAFLLDKHFEDFIKVSIKYTLEEDVPIIKLFSSYTNEQLVELSKPSNLELLTAIANNELEAYIELSLKNYVNNRIPLLDQAYAMAEDIAIGAYIRRKTFAEFINSFTLDPEVSNGIKNEVDRLTTIIELRSFDTYIEIQNNNLKAINKKLAQSEELLLEAQELANMGSFVWDLTGGKSIFTPGVMKIFEMKETSKLDVFMENVHEDDRYKLQESLDRAFIENGNFNCEYRFIKNGKEKKIWSKGVVTFQEGKPLNLKGTVTDVTLKEDMLRKLQESEEMNKKAQSITHLGNWIWEIEENKIIWSDEMYRIYGFEPQSQEISFDLWFSLIDPQGKEKRLQNICESLQTLHAVEYQIHLTTASGINKVLQSIAEVITDKNNIPVRLIGTSQDVTKEYSLNEEIHLKEEYLKGLINNAPDSVIVIDGEGTINLWNPKTEEIFGWKEEEVIGKKLSETIIPHQYREAHIKGLKRLQDTGVAKVFNKTLELTALNKKGKEFYISITISQSIQKGKFLFIAFLRDISVEKQIKAELQNKTLQLENVNTSLESKNTELERINKELESFNFVASHDLQEPLRKIQIFSNRILDKGKTTLTPDLSDYFEKIRTSSHRMQLLIEDLLTFSQTNAEENNFALTDLNEIVEEVKNILSQTIEETKAVIESTYLPVLRVIPFQIQQLLVNLISNAIKYSKDTETPVVKITSSVVRGEKINLSMSGKRYVEIQVTDNGIGFEEENAEKIFGLFQRLHSKDKYSGTGIGLAICKKIAHNHNGHIIARSTPKIGSAFYVYIPLVGVELFTVNLA